MSEQVMTFSLIKMKIQYFIDKLIEVKSYENIVNFYWSNNEMEVAKKEQDNYFLCLVDRNEISNSGYDPIMIQNPI